jgi:hypothetical protein
VCSPVACGHQQLYSLKSPYIACYAGVRGVHDFQLTHLLLLPLLLLLLLLPLLLLLLPLLLLLLLLLQFLRHWNQFGLPAPATTTRRAAAADDPAAVDAFGPACIAAGVFTTAVLVP